MNNVIQSIPLTLLITSELHPHLEFQADNLDNLVNSIKKYGIIEPLLVRPKDNKFEIILGNRRYNAAKQLGLDKVPVIITNINDEIALNMIISDNIQRKELTSKEEARLYDKALSFPNINKEQLSINLGIPLDRIASKLELLKKESPTIDNNKIENEAQYQNENNSVNNDIISLSELDKEEKERDEIYMNNNQFMDNNINNNVNLNNGVENNGQPSPTFGGRFFPSMEDEPTNMNMGGINPQQMPSNNMGNDINNNLNSSPLIDLTDTGNDIIQEENMNVQNIPNMNQIQQPEPTIPGQDPSMVVPNIPDLNQAPTNTGNSLPNMEGFNNGHIDNNMMENSIPDFTNQVQQPIPDINETPTNNMPNMNIPQQNMVEQPMAQEMLNTANIPNIEVPGNQMNIPNYNIPEQQVPQGKDIVPVVNMIKNLAMSIESLGYKLNISENDDNQYYSINIEVEK